MSRTLERLRAHYEVEKELAQRLKTAGRDERKHLYPLVYQELYRRVPDHPRNVRKYDPLRTEAQVREKMAFLEGFLTPETRFLEIGAGDCSLTMEVARRVRRAYAFDVARQIRDGVELPANLEMVIMPDGCVIPLPDNAVTLAYSNQVMEHIHQEDAYQQLTEIYRVIEPGGRYICITPNRASGPHDVSRHFDEEASCFHLIEYRMRQLADVLRRAGFARIHAYTGLQGRYLRVSQGLVSGLESVLLGLPYKLRRPLSNGPVVRSLLFLTLVAEKDR